MSDIDEISRTLGKMQSDISHILHNTDAMDKKIDAAHEIVIEVKSATKSAHRRIDNITPHVEDYKKMKNQGVGMIAMLSLVFGAIGSGILKFLQAAF